jgi:predicted SprT family Zn-dependent metalloprotease
MDLNKAEDLCRGLMNKHGLSHWQFQYDNSVRRFGVCKYNIYNQSGVIGLSRKLVAVNDEEQVRDTILHEIAHALTRGHGHDAVWKAKCVEIGAKPERCYSSKDTNMAEMRYQAICGGCGRKHQKTRIKYKEAKRSCKCQSHKGWDEKILLNYIDTKK